MSEKEDTAEELLECRGFLKGWDAALGRARKEALRVADHYEECSNSTELDEGTADGAAAAAVVLRLFGDDILGWQVKNIKP